MAQTTNLERSLANFTQPFGLKGKNSQYQFFYSMNKRRGTETLKIVGLPYAKEYEFVPRHLESLEVYSEYTTDWCGDVIYRLTPFTIMEHSQMQMIGNRFVPYLNQN